MRNSSHPQFKIVLAVVDKKLSLPREHGGMMDKLKHILWYTFVFTPLIFACGLGIIVIDNKKIINASFFTKKIKKTKKQIDKDKFNALMKRITK